MTSNNYSSADSRLTPDSPDYNSLSPVQTHLFSSGFRNHTSPYRNAPESLRDRVTRVAEQAQNHCYATYYRLSPFQRILAVLSGILITVLGILFLVFNERIFGFFASFAQSWRDLTGGWLILWFMTLGVAFPPMIGYSSCVTAAGFVYGFPKGWFIVATASVVGSACSFLVCRTFLRKTVERLTAADQRFAALSHVIKHDGLKLLIMIRLCPLPYSLSNGAIATIPTVNPMAFAIATAIASPKLLLPIFIGTKLADIAENGGEMDGKTKALSYISIVLGSLAGLATGWIVYRQTQARAKQLEAEESSHHWEDLEPAADYVDNPALSAGEVDDITRRTTTDTSLGFHDSDKNGNSGKIFRG